MMNILFVIDTSSLIYYDINNNKNFIFKEIFMNDRQIYAHTKNSVGTRQYLDFQTTFHNSHATKTSDEFWSEGFSAENIAEIIDACNRTGMPANVSIRLKISPNENFNTIKLVILPTLMDARMTCYENASELAYYASPEIIRRDTELVSKKQKRAFSALAREQEEMIKEYIRAELIDMYFILAGGDTASKEVLDYIKTLTIVKEKYDLDRFDAKSIEPFKLKDTKEKPFEEALYEFAKNHATQNRKNNKLAVVYGLHTNYVGLQKPQNPATISNYAHGLANLSMFRRKQTLELGFMEDYKAKKQRPYTGKKTLVFLPTTDPSTFQPQ